MRKRLLLIALVIILSTGTVVQTEMRAEAAATVTAVTVAKAVLVLLAIAGVGITAGTIFDQGDINESAVVKFTTWLNNHDPEFYTQFMIAASAVTAGRVVNTLSPLFYSRLRQNAREYFGTVAGTQTSVGSTTFNILDLAFYRDGSQWLINQSGLTVRSDSGYYNIEYLPCVFTYDGQLALFTVPTSATYFDSFAVNVFGAFGSGYWNSVSNLRVNGKNYYTYWYLINGTNFTSYNTKATCSTNDQVKSLIQSTLDNLYSGNLTTASEDVYMAPFTTIGDVAATSVDATVVGAGQTITEDGNGEIVIDGDTTLNLSNVNIDEWLKSLADGTQTYAEAMQAIGLAAVNTQTQTLEEVQAIAQALNPAAAGTGSITGNYTVALSELFPFCIPFDLYNIISCFKADPVAPSAEITIPVGYDSTDFTWETYTVSLSAFDPVAAVVRVLEYVAFIIGLMLVTRKLIEG